MHVIDHSTLPRLHQAGRRRFAAAGRQFGFAAFELWIETLEVNARADLEPQHSDRVVLVLAGHGNMHLDSGPQRFHAPCSLMLPAGAECQVVNIGAEALEYVMVFTTPLVNTAADPAPDA
jgi:mannose-6-phosphate isomerase-like protein (cupin superfamily)